MNFEATLKLIASAFAADSQEWAVIGGLGLSFHGAPRSTIDVDVLVLRSSLSALDQVLESEDYILNYRWDESSHFVPSKGSDLAPVDVLHAHRPHACEMLKRAEKKTMARSGHIVPVARAEDLAGLKLQSACNDPQRKLADLADIRRLFELAASKQQPLERTVLEEYFGIFDRLPLLEELLEGLDGAVR